MNAQVSMPDFWWDITDCVKCLDKTYGFRLCEYHEISKSDDPAVRAEAVEKIQSIAKEKERIRLEKEEQQRVVDIQRQKDYESYYWKDVCERYYKSFQDYIDEILFPKISFDLIYQPAIIDRRYKVTSLMSKINDDLENMERVEAHNYFLFNDTRGHYQDSFKKLCTCSNAFLIEKRRHRKEWKRTDKQLKYHCMRIAKDYIVCKNNLTRMINRLSGRKNELE